MDAKDDLRRKQALFDGLYALDNENNDTPDTGLAESVTALAGNLKSGSVVDDGPKRDMIRNSPGKPALKANTGTLGTPSLPKRAASDLGAISSKTNAALPLKEQPVPPATLQHRHTVTGSEETMSLNMPTFSAIPRAIGKRKRDSIIKHVPENQRIFNDLHFFFFPNNDVHPARRMRIIKALEYGATWQKDWTNSVTHVIVDKSMNYGQLIAFLKMSALPESVILVDEVYPADCISYRLLLDAKQTRYLVKGQPAPSNDPAPLEIASAQPSQGSSVSLELKPAGKSVMARPPKTPSRTQESSSGAPLATSNERPEEAQSNNGGRERASILTGSDELDAAIRQAKEFQDIPVRFEEEEEEGSRPGSSSAPGTDDEGCEPTPKKQKQKQRGNPDWQDKFQCMQKHTGTSIDCANSATIDVLQKMADYYVETRDEWRSHAYRKAIATLRKHPVKIHTKTEALALPGIGGRLADKIEEIVDTNRLRRLENALLEPNDRTLQTFLKIYGVGHAQASRWVSLGYKSLQDLLSKATLSENQLIGIKHFDDFNARIPRAEVAAHGEVVRSTLLSIDAQFEVYTMGSYRRGAEDSGDIDLIITRPATPLTQIRTTVTEVLIPQLFKDGFLKATLAGTSGDGTKWHGASCLPSSSVWRRIDFLLVPPEELGAALIYFTGNDIFNRSLRLLASRKGMRLNQRGLYRDVMMEAGRVKLTQGTLVEGANEKKIFEALGVPWRPPEHRIC